MKRAVQIVALTGLITLCTAWLGGAELMAAPVASAGITNASYSMPAGKPAPVASAGIINGSYSLPNGTPQTVATP